MRLLLNSNAKARGECFAPILRARQLIPIERSWARPDQRGRDHTFVRGRRWADMIHTGITLRQYSSLLFELLMPQGNIFQHCASAREFGAQINDLECGEAISSSNMIISWKLVHHDELVWKHNSSQNEATDTPLAQNQSSWVWPCHIFARAHSYRAIMSWVRSKVSRLHIFMDAPLGKYTPHRYYSPAVQRLALRVTLRVQAYSACSTSHYSSSLSFTELALRVITLRV